MPDKIVYGFKFQTTILNSLLFDPDSDDRITILEHLQEKSESHYFADEIGIFIQDEQTIIGVFVEINKNPFTLPSQREEWGFEVTLQLFLAGVKIVKDIGKYQRFLIQNTPVVTD